MSTVSLEEFIKPFSEALGRVNSPEHVEDIDTDHSVQFILADAMTETQIIDKFIAEAKKIGVEVVTTTAISLSSDVVKTAQLFGGSTVILPASEDANNIEQALTNSGFSVSRWNAQNGREEIEKAATQDIGITFAYGGIAETGSVVQLASAGSGRSIGTIPPSHIAIVAKSKIFSRIGYALDAIKKDFGNEMPSNITVISGPSATADIELVRVVGVHGPVRTAIVLVEDQ